MRPPAYHGGMVACALLASPWLLGVASLGVAQAQDPEQGLVVAPLEWEPGTAGGAGLQSVDLSDQPPYGVRLPPDVAEGWYGGVPLGEELELAVVVDVAPGKERIWVDHDLDADFHDDPYARCTKNGSVLSRSATLLVPLPGEERPVPVEANFTAHLRAGSPTLSLSLRIHRIGEVVLGDRLRRLALRDDDHRLLFDQGENVVLLLDVDGDGQWASEHGSHEHFHLGDAIRLGEEGWSFSVPDASGGRIEFQRLAEPPPRVPREWRGRRAPPSPYQVTPPQESDAELARRFEQEKDQDYGKRYATIRLLGYRGTEAAYALLAAAAEDDPDRRVRVAAVGAMGNEAYLAAHGKEVLGLARGDEPDLAAAAVQSLYRMGHPDLEGILLSLLDSREDQVIAAAAQHLGYLATPDAREAVLELVSSRPETQIRHRAYLGIRNWEGGPPAELMVRCARDPDASLRALALEDLFTSDHPQARGLALEALQGAPPTHALVQAASRVLVAAGDREAVEAVFTLGVSGPVTLRRSLAGRLATLRSKDAVAVMLQNLGSRAAERRILSAQVLAGITDSEVSAALAKQLRRERDLDVAVEIVAALAEQGDEDAVEALLRVAKKKGPLRGPGIQALARSGSAEPAARRFLLQLINGQAWRDRLFGIDAAAASGDVTLGRKVLPHLADSHWEVRLASVQALRALRAPEWVRPLILRLGKEEKPRLRIAIAQTLFELTGVNLYTNEAVWERWWKDHGHDFEMPAVVPVVPRSGQEATVAGFYGLPVDSDRLAFVIDQSGSMSAQDASDQSGTGTTRRTRLEQAVVETLNAVGGLPDDARVNVILFESVPHPWEDEIVPLNKSNRKKLERHLRQQRPMGGTNLYDGLELALMDPEVDTVILLSDGMPGAGKYVATQDILRAVERVNQARRITIHCVSLGRDSALLEGLARAHGGRYVRR